MGPSAGTNQAMGLAGAAGLNALNTQYDPASFNVNQLQTGSFTQPGAASAYMDPYMQNVVDIQKREAQRAANIAGTGRNAQAVKAGAFGGSRQAIMDAEAQRNLAQQMGDIQAKGSSAAYNQAMQQFNAEQQLGLTAQTGNQQQNLEAQKLVEQSRQYGAGQGMQGLQTALTGAGAACQYRAAAIWSGDERQPTAKPIRRSATSHATARTGHSISRLLESTTLPIPAVGVYELYSARHPNGHCAVYVSARSKCFVSDSRSGHCGLRRK